MSILDVVLEILESNQELGNAFYFDSTDAFHRDAVIILSRKTRSQVDPMIIFTQEALDDRRITPDEISMKLKKALPSA